MMVEPTFEEMVDELFAVHQKPKCIIVSAQFIGVIQKTWEDMILEGKLGMKLNGQHRLIRMRLLVDIRRRKKQKPQMITGYKRIPKPTIMYGQEAMCRE
jgi:hypothetical protein